MVNPGNPMPINPRNVMHNSKSLNFSRTSLSVLSGGVAGILGLSSLWGFLFYFLVSGLLGLYYLAQRARSDSLHFLNKQQLVTGFVFENLFTYILMWTLVYGCVHVYWIFFPLLKCFLKIFSSCYTEALPGWFGANLVQVISSFWGPDFIKVTYFYCICISF